jgi:probable O-glycosylation ligase (exosortase A-associated)
MRSVFLLAIFLALLGFGLRAPFVLVLGYVWVDLVTPQRIAYVILDSMPVSLIYGGAAFFAALLPKSDPSIRLRPTLVLLVIFAAWMTLSLLWAAVPEAATEKWSWAIKTVLFACVMPYLIRTRVQLEALVWTIVICGMAHCIPFGAKVVLSGGGYGKALGLAAANSGLGEGSTLAMFATMLVPLCWFLMRHSTIVPLTRLTKLMLGGFALAAILTALGTYARTGLVAIGILALCAISVSKRKALLLTTVGAVALVGSVLVADKWMNRMETLGSLGTEDSAMGRLAVWRWTLEYVGAHPLGGSFGVYRINTYEMVLEDGRLFTVAAKAFHSIYFEVLGELGIPGFILFVLIALSVITTLAHARRSAASDRWLKDLSGFVLTSLAVFLVSGAFIGVGFQPYFYYLASIAVTIHNLCMRRRMETLSSGVPGVGLPSPTSSLSFPRPNESRR